LAERIHKKYQVQPVLIEGGGGIFDVKLDDELIFSKHQVDRFPEGDEVLDAIGSRRQ
jgi:selT/selW/selH-like putative selenoprotein